MQLNKVDREILEILKDVFQLRRIRPMESDHNFRLWMIRLFFLVSVFSLIVRAVLGIQGYEITAEYSAMVQYSNCVLLYHSIPAFNNEVDRY